MESNTIYYISEAAKLVQVETHVLRYWEEELQLPIKRNEMGHRYYTGKDIRQLQEIKVLKEQGLQLKAIRAILPKTSQDTAAPGRETAERQDGSVQEGGSKAVETVENKTRQEQKGDASSEYSKLDNGAKEAVLEKAQKYMVTLTKDKGVTVETGISSSHQEDTLPEYPAEEEKNQKAARLQYLLQHMITEAVKTANQELCTEVKESILKELDYQFRMQEERDEERWKKEEEHYRKIDEMIRERHKPREKFGKGKKKSPIV